MIRRAVYTKIQACPNGCPVIVFSDENQEPFAEAHLNPAMLEEIIADLRAALIEGEALRRPPA